MQEKGWDALLSQLGFDLSWVWEIRKERRDGVDDTASTERRPSSTSNSLYSLLSLSLRVLGGPVLFASRVPLARRARPRSQV